MRYQPYGPGLDAPHIMLGGVPLPGASLTLSNEPGVPSPAAWRADTLTETVLRALADDAGRRAIAAADAVTSDRFDADHLVAIWACLEPEAALARRGRLVAAARAGLFGVFREPEAAYVACWVTSSLDAEARDVEAAYATLLPQVATALDRPRDLDLVWIGEYSDVIRAESMLNSGAVEIEEHPDLDLSVMQTPLRLHDLTRFSAMEGCRVLTVRTENTYIVEYRVESWVQLASRRPLPRIDLRPLAARLALFERAPGRWHAEPVDWPRPRLYLDAGSGRPSPSSIDAETVTGEVLDYFRAAAGRPELHWSAYHAGRPAA